jgi:hypothetical protein
MERVSAEIDARVDQWLEEQDVDYDLAPGQIGVATGSIAVNVLYARSRR